MNAARAIVKLGGSVRAFVVVGRPMQHNKLSADVRRILVGVCSADFAAVFSKASNDCSRPEADMSLTVRNCDSCPSLLGA